MITHSSAARRPSLRGSRRLLSLLVVGGAVSTSLLTAGPAFAAEAAASPVAASPVVSQSCWEDVDTGATGCFTTGLDAQEQIELATGVPLVADETQGDTSARAQLAAGSRASGSRASSAAVNYLLVTAWDGVNKTGDSKSYFTSNAKICSGFLYSFQNLSTFNDRFESLQSFNGCATTLYDDVDFDGAFTSPIVESNDLGTFRNRASSLDVEKASV